MERLIKKFLFDFKNITNHYNYLVDCTKKYESVGISNEWLLDNYYLIVEYKNIIFENKKYLSKLIKKSNNIYNAINDIVIRNNYNINFKILTKEINNYQKKNNYNFNYKELSLIKTLLFIIYTSKLSEFCNYSYKIINTRHKISKLISNNNEDNILNSLNFKDNIYIFELNNKLKSLGKKSNKILKKINIILEENNISLKEIINEQYQILMNINILMTNIFTNLKEFILYNNEDIFEHMSKCEKLLLDDKIYENMTKESKELYRKKIEKNAHKLKISEVDYIEKLFSNEEYYLEDKNYHIGSLLFKNKSKNIKMYIYILIICLISFSSTIFLSKYFLKNRIISFLVLFIPVLQIIIQITNQIINRFIKTIPLLKMDYSKKVPKESSTMIVIPTLISNKEKIKEMFSLLETFYITNNTDNLYFTLLGDVKQSDKEICDYDQELIDYGLEISNKLSKKYKKDIFHFLYRKRIWNEQESTYMGYERKRGALLEFNKLLLNKYSKREIKQHYSACSFKSIPYIKYVITLDTDNKLVLNSALNLIGCMAHPLNKPILNKQENKVIFGYGLMQPRLDIDLESTNKSLYSQIFAGVGGFDAYTSTIPNTYQDLFNEGSFEGKGIYDLEIFDKILSNRFKDNLILSHDLLEGNFLRCGYVSDIELIDGFPSDFLVDMSL